MVINLTMGGNQALHSLVIAARYVSFATALNIR